MELQSNAQGAMAVPAVGKKRLMHDIIREALQSSAPKRGARRDNSSTPPQNGSLEALTSSSTPDAIVPVDTSAADAQLIFDENGNIVLSAPAVSSKPQSSFAFAAGTVVDASTSGYEFAYKKTKPTKWSPEETDRFYSALEKFGSDLMLVNTFFPSLNSTQIRQKFKTETRKQPQRVSEAVKRKAKLIAPVSPVMNTPQGAPAIPLDLLDDLLQI